MTTQEIFGADSAEAETPIDLLREKLKSASVGEIAVQHDHVAAAAILAQGTMIRVRPHESEHDVIAAAKVPSNRRNITVSLLPVDEHNDVNDEHYVAACRANRLIMERIAAGILTAEGVRDAADDSGYILAASRGPAFN